MKALLTSFVSGMVFALGLGISGMTRPIKVIGFLDFFGSWDPSLAFVMIGAICVYFVANRWSQKMPSFPSSAHMIPFIFSSSGSSSATRSDTIIS